MNIFEKYKNKWMKKKLFDKITDILFYLLIIAMIIPGSRTAITVGVKRVFAFAPKVISSDQRETIADNEYYWEMETLNGQRINLVEYAGKTIFLNEWATWCPPCIAEMPSIEKLYLELKDDKNVTFVIVTNEKKSVVQEFINKNGYTFPVMIARSETPAALFSPSIPTTFVISPDGEIVLKEVGSKKWHGQATVDMIRALYGR